MKKLFLLLAFTLAITAISISAYSQRTDIKSFTSTTGDSINDISGTDTTLYYAVRGNSDWSITASTGTITGYSGIFQVIGSNDGTRWFNYPNKYQVIYNSDDSTVYDKTYGIIYHDTIASNNRYVYTDNSLPYLYIGIKVTKGTCSGKFYSTFVMKRPD